MLISSYACNSQNLTYTITKPYKFPITPENREEWVKLTSIVKKKEACQIPKNIVESMTTEALIETVLAYPIFPVEQAFTEPAHALDGYLDFNGFIELFSRSDAAIILFKIYIDEKYNEDISSPDYLKNLRIKMLLARPEIWSKLDDQDLKRLRQTNIKLYPEDLYRKKTSDIPTKQGEEVLRVHPN
ncbi:MAG: hypothetical protein ACM3TR_03220 [Caulobacteraceae bacterium]